MLFNPLVLLAFVVQRQLFHILVLHKVRHSFARMNVLVDLHENFLWHSDEFARSIRILSILLMFHLILEIISVRIARGIVLVALSRWLGLQELINALVALGIMHESRKRLHLGVDLRVLRQLVGQDQPFLAINCLNVLLSAQQSRLVISYSALRL